MKNTIQVILLSGILLSQTAEQISQAKQVIRKTGMSEVQVREAAKGQGFTSKQIEDAISKEKTSRNKTEDYSISPDLKNSDEFLNQNLKSQDLNKIDNEEILGINDDKEEIVDESENNFETLGQPGKRKLKYFGYDIFKRDPSFFQATSVGAVDPDYLIGPGDEMIVMLWGETQFRQVLTVDREGFVFIPEIGQVFVNGLNLNLLESKLFRVFSQSYASLNPQGRTPTTFLDVSLGNLRPLRIQVLGEVSQPGAYTVSPSSTLFSSLYYFNGPTTLGSLRDIQLIRGGEKIASIDFYDYLLTGRKLKDQKLQLDDVIFIPPRLKTVKIEGEINRGGVYELKQKETLTDLIALAGGLKATAYLDRSQIDRIVPFEDRKELGMDRMYTDVNIGHVINSKHEFYLKDGDHMQIFSISDSRQNSVDLRGAVTRPGVYDLGDSLKLSELLNNADGLLGDAYLDRVDIIRTRPDFSEELIKLNLGEVVRGDLNNDIKLQGLDKVRVYGMAEMVSKSYVTITGHVRRSGRFPIRENMKLFDLIFRAGGFIDEEFKNRTYMERADLLRVNQDGITRSIISFNLGELLKSPESEENLELKADDIIKIYKNDIFIRNKSVSINGVVRKPGDYTLKSGMSLKDLILEAGGLNSNVYRYRAEVARINPLNSDLDKYALIISFNVDDKFRMSTIQSSKHSKDIISSEVGEFRLEAYDYVYIRPDPFFTNQKQVEVSGEVLFPGKYTILSSDEKITDIIDRAGGPKRNAYLGASVYQRKGENISVPFKKIIKNSNSKLNFNVQDGDKIVLAPYPNLVRVIGEVNSSGIHKFIPGKKIAYYLNLAGGLTMDAEKENIWIKYPNGDAKKYKKWSLFNSKVIDGSSIIVGKRKEEEPFDRTEYAKEISTIVANLAQALSLVLIARQ